MGELLRLIGVDELENVGRVTERANPALLPANSTPDSREYFEREIGTIVAGLMQCAAERFHSFSGRMPLDELSNLVDDGDGIEVALALRIAPREQTMTAEDDAVAAGILLDRPLQHHGQLKTRPLPGYPGELMAEFLVELLHLLPPVGGSGECDGPVGVEVVDVIEGQKAVERGVDGGRDGVVAEGDQRIERNHLILARDAGVDLFERQQLVEVEGGEAGALDAAEVAAGAFDPEHAFRLAVEWIGLVEFGAGVAAAEVGYAEVGAEEVGTVAEQLGRIELRRQGFVPFVLEKTQLGAARHVLTSMWGFYMEHNFT